MGRRFSALVGALVLVVTSCSSGDAAIEIEQTEPTPSSSADSSAVADSSSTTQAPSTTVTPTQTIPRGLPGVAAITSGRGDDGSLEVAVWFGSDPFTDDGTRLIVGTDSDESYPGTGDPRPHLDGWIEIDSSGSRFVAGDVVADDESGDLAEWFSWSGPGRVLRLYFIGNVPKRAGTLWVILERDGSPGVGAIAGAPFGTECSYHDAGIDLGVVPGDTPRFGPCRYPFG